MWMSVWRSVNRLEGLEIERESPRVTPYCEDSVVSLRQAARARPAKGNA